jgi:hypothetical protein
MSSTGTALMNRVLIALSAAGLTVWRNNTAVGWAGKSLSLRPGEIYRARGGERVVFNARPVRAGLCEGSSDIVGIEAVTITPDMVGRTVAIFHAWEVKDGSGRLSAPQRRFLEHVEDRGGVAAVVRSVDEALQAVFTRRR